MNRETKAYLCLEAVVAAFCFSALPFLNCTPACSG